MEKNGKKNYLILGSICLLLTSLIFLKKEARAEEYQYFLEKYKPIQKWLPYVKEFSKKYQIDPALVAAIIYQESKGNPYVISPAGAIGLMQLMPSTALKICGYTQDKLLNPYYNIECGTKYLAYLYRQTGDYSWAIAKYYGGTKATPWSSFGSPPVYIYVRNVLNHFENLKNFV